MAWALDLDGVVWRGDEGVPGAAEAVRLLQDAGERVLFVTNNSGRRVVDTEKKAVLGGARVLATNDDVTFPAHDGLRPGAGSLLAALVAATGVTPEKAGKPYGPMCDLVRELAGDDGTMVGDRPDTDGRFARALGWRWSLVLSGLVGPDDLPVDPEPDSVNVDLLAAVREHLG